MRRRYLGWLLTRCPTLFLYGTFIAFFARRVVHMGNWSFWDWLGYGGVAVAAIFIAIDTAIAQSEHLSRHLPRLLKGYMGFLPLAFMVCGTSAFAYQQLNPTDILRLPPGAQIGSPFGTVQAWGMDNGVFYMVVKTGDIVKDRKLSRLVLIVRGAFTDIDGMTDNAIIKSQSYTIVDGFMTLAIPTTSSNKLRVLLNGRPTPIQFNLIELPFLFSPDQITSLADVEYMGGRILASTETAATFASTTSPPNVCPPSPEPPASQAGTTQKP